ncbi:UNVERIFIED_CONTAM: hypothetical protein RMT77_008504 [Armadillidium vulgare]
MVSLDLTRFRQESLALLGKLIRTKDPLKLQDTGVTGPPGTKLKKVLTTFDLTSLGVGSCVGTGMYLVSGMVARSIAGPGVILSFIIAAVASIFSGVCYAEFGVRVPNTSGGAYMYSYVTVGEFMAFVIGWNMVLEELIGTSACACALSACFDALANGAISNGTANAFGTIMGRPPDFIAFILTIMMGAVLVAGVRKSIMFNNILNAINFIVWIFIMGAGFYYADSKNWSEHGGFMPYGWSGVLTGAATCFYAFIGFDIIATTGEEAVNARKSIPHAIVLSLIIILIAYVTSSAVITLIVPYTDIDEDAALVEAFGTIGATSSKNVVAIGALAGLTVSMFGSMFSLPRIVYAMAKDGLVFKKLAEVWLVTGTPAVATVVFGLGAAFAALLISLNVLVEMMSIGTLLAYTLVSTCVLILRYQPHSSNLIDLLPESIRTPLAGTPLPGSPTRKIEKGLAVSPQNLTVALEQQNGGRVTPGSLGASQKVTIKKVTRHSLDSDDSGQTEGGSGESSRREDDYMVSDKAENKFYGSVPNAPRVSHWYDRYVEALQGIAPSLFPWVLPGPCTEETGRYVMKLVGFLYLVIITFDILLVACLGELEGHSPAASFFCLLLFGAIMYLLILISRQPQNTKSLPFLAPGLPWIPAIAIIINIYLILKLSILTLIRFVVWMTIGMGIYFYYGIKYSTVDEEMERDGNIELHINPEMSAKYSSAAAVSNNINYESTNFTSRENTTESDYMSPNPNNPFRSS